MKNSTMTFLFDVDGTLTDARKPIDKEFESFLQEFIKHNKCFIVTGSDRPKTVEQIGLELQMLLIGIIVAEPCV